MSLRTTCSGVCLFLVVIVGQAFLPSVWAARLPIDLDQPAGVTAPGPDRQGLGTMEDEVEASVERVRHHLRRPVAGSRNLLMKSGINTVPVYDPRTLPGAVTLAVVSGSSE